MRHSIKTADELAWLLTHTQGFHSGYVTDVHMSKRRLFDEESGREVLAGATVTTVIRYQIRGIARVAKLTMIGVTDFSIFEQEGMDCSRLGVIHAEATGDRLRFWFDPQGELYVVCEEAELEEVSKPTSVPSERGPLAQWTFQAESGDEPTVQWLLAQLDQVGLPCSWRAAKPRGTHHPGVRWEGELILASDGEAVNAGAVSVQAYGPLDGRGFGVVLQMATSQQGNGGRALDVVADVIARHFTGTCLVGNTVVSGADWLSWKFLER